MNENRNRGAISEATWPNFLATAIAYAKRLKKLACDLERAHTRAARGAIARVKTVRGNARADVRENVREKCRDKCREIVVKKA